MANMTSDKDIDKDEEDEEGSEDDDEEEDEEETEQEEEEDDDEQHDNMLSADPGEVQMNNAGETLNGDLENIFDADDADADAVGPGQYMGDNISADMHLSSTAAAAAASMGGSINSSNNNGKARPPADALAQGQTWQDEKSDREFRKTLIKDMYVVATVSYTFCFLLLPSIYLMYPFFPHPITFRSQCDSIEGKKDEPNGQVDQRASI